MNYTEIVNINGKGCFEIEMKDLTCKYCNSKNVVKYGKYNDVQYLWCKDCKRKFTTKNTLPSMKTPTNQIAAAIGMYYEGLSQNEIDRTLQQVYDLNVSDFAIYNWVERFTKDAIQITNNYQPKTGYVWAVDETAVFVGGKQHWLIDIIDIKTRFLLASRLSKYRRVEDAQATLEQAYNRSGTIPKVIISDRLQAYQDAIPLTFGNKAKHLQVKKFAARPNNNILERMQGTIRSRLKTMRGLKSLDTARTVIDGFLINYNYFRPHETLSTKDNQRTPAQAAQIQFPYSNWESLIKHSQEAKTQVPSNFFNVPKLPKVELTARQKQLVYARRHRRKLLEQRKQTTIGIITTRK